MRTGLSRFGVVVLLAYLVFPSSLPGQQTVGFGPEGEARIDAVFARMDSTHMPGCALGVMAAGSPSYLQGYGMANLEYDIPISPPSVFHVASVSKQFTAFAVSLLAAEGKVLGRRHGRYVPKGRISGRSSPCGTWRTIPRGFGPVEPFEPWRGGGSRPTSSPRATSWRSPLGKRP